MFTDSSCNYTIDDTTPAYFGIYSKAISEMCCKQSETWCLLKFIINVICKLVLSNTLLLMACPGVLTLAFKKQCFTASFIPQEGVLFI